MLVDFKTLSPIERIRWHLLPNPNDGWLLGEAYRCGDAFCILQKRPACISGDDLVAIEWAASILRKKAHAPKKIHKPMDAYELVLSISIDQEDLRALADTSGTDLRELQEEYGTKGYFGPLHCKVYSADEYEDLGVYEGANTLEDVRQFLLDTVCDTLDILDEPEEQAFLAETI